MKIRLVLLIIFHTQITFIHSMDSTDRANRAINDIAVTWDCDIQTVWVRARKVISNHIKKHFGPWKWYSLSWPSLEKSIAVAKVPAELFPDLAPLFNNNFFSNLRNRNDIFDYACFGIIDYYQNSIKKSLNGSNIDTFYDDEPISELSQQTKSYLWALILKNFYQTQTGLIKTKHTAVINNIAFNNKTKRIASASDDKTAQVWCLKTGIREHNLQHDDAVLTVSFYHDGSRLATATKTSCIVRIWNMVTGNIMHTLSQNIFNRAYYDLEKTWTLITLNTDQKIAKVATWLCPPDEDPVLVANISIMRATFPLVEQRGGTTITHYPYTIKKAGLFDHDISCTRRCVTPNLCTIAFNNSKKNKVLLEALCASKAFNRRLYDVDKLSLQKSIDKQLALLSER